MWLQGGLAQVLHLVQSKGYLKSSMHLTHGSRLMLIGNIEGDIESWDGFTYYIGIILILIKKGIDVNN